MATTRLLKRFTRFFSWVTTSTVVPKSLMRSSSIMISRDRLGSRFPVGSSAMIMLGLFTKALKGINLRIDDGEFVFLVGPSGSGKSTIIKLITGEIALTEGKLMVNGYSMSNISPRQVPLMRRTLGIIFQDFRLIDKKTVYENLSFAMRAIGASPRDVKRRIPYVLQLVGLEHKADRYPGQLSGGEQQRVALARALVNDPPLIIADEPTGNVDPALSYEIVQLLQEINKCGTTILMVTHDMGSIIKYCDKVVLLNKGEFVAEGTAGHMVDLYKKILAGQMDSLNAELAKEREESAADHILMSDFSGGITGDQPGSGPAEGTSGGLMKDQITINANRTEYGDGRAEIYDLGLLDERGNLTNLLLKGEMFTIRECIRFNADIEAPIFTYTIKDKKGTELTGTNTLYEGADIRPVKAGDEYQVEFTQKMTLQGGEYLLSMSCTGFEQGEHVVYHRLYDVANITVISNKNTVGVYDMESQVKAVKK